MNVYLVDFTLDKSMLQFVPLAPNVYTSQDCYICYTEQFTGMLFTSQTTPKIYSCFWFNFSRTVSAISSNHFIYLQTYYLKIW